MAMYKVVLEKIYMILTLLQWDFFSRLLMHWGQISFIFCNDATVVPYLKKIQKTYKPCDNSLEFCWHEHFFTENQQVLLYQKYRYRLHLNT